MARYVSWVVGIVLLGASAASAASLCEPQRPPEQKQPTEGRRESGTQPPWKWWINADSRKELGITDQQSAQIDQIFESTMQRQRITRHDLEQLEAELSKTIKEGSADVAALTQQVEGVERVRAEYQTARTVMLYRINRVLSPEQRVKVDALRAKWQENHPKQPAGKSGR